MKVPLYIIQNNNIMSNDNKKAKMALHHPPEYQTSFESNGLSVQEKQFKYIFKMMAVVAILDF